MWDDQCSRSCSLLESSVLLLWSSLLYIKCSIDSMQSSEHYQRSSMRVSARIRISSSSKANGNAYELSLQSNHFQQKMTTPFAFWHTQIIPANGCGTFTWNLLYQVWLSLINWWHRWFPFLTFGWSETILMWWIFSIHCLWCECIAQINVNALLGHKLDFFFIFNQNSVYHGIKPLTGDTLPNYAYQLYLLMVTPF